MQEREGIPLLSLGEALFFSLCSNKNNSKDSDDKNV